MRARVVDLAGNSLAPRKDDIGAENPDKRARAFLRYEPVTAPVLALRRPGGSPTPTPIEGESMDRMAVRTFNDTSNNVPAGKDAWRMGVPPQVSVRDAEHHGKLDAAGVVDSSTFAVLANQKDRDASDPAAALRAEKIPMKGPLDDVPVETTFAVYGEGETLTYLPDPLAERVAVRVFDHPNIADTEIIDVPLYDAGASWPEARPFRIQLSGNAAGKPSYDAPSHTLLLPLPQAVRARVRLSMELTPSQRSLLGVWNWLTAAQQSSLDKLSQQGQHWMLTPWRTVEIVHAVQRPLIVPEIAKLSIGRSLGATSAIPRFSASCSIKSTDRIDVRAEWHEPQDLEAETDSEAIQVDRSRGDTAFHVKITDPKAYALKLAGEARGGYPDHIIESEDRIEVGLSHDLVTPKHHEFHDSRYRRIGTGSKPPRSSASSCRRRCSPRTWAARRMPIEDHIKVVGPRVVNWIPSSAPPPAPEVLYIVPTFGWTRATDAAGQPSSWRRGGGLRVYLDRPWNVSGYGEMLGVVLPPPTLAQNPDISPAGQPYKNYITQWANDPIWLSPFVSGIAPKRTDFPLARVAPDPAGGWLPKDAPADERDQRPGPFVVSGLLPPGVNPGSPAPVVDVAPHDVRYDDGAPAVVLRHRGGDRVRPTPSSASRSPAISRRRSRARISRTSCWPTSCRSPRIAGSR